MSALERRYRWLLRAYPACYRAQRGDEMLATLLEASASERSWPAARDTRALIVGGLRVRAWQDHRQTTAAAVRQAVLLGAVLDLAPWSARNLGLLAVHGENIRPSLVDVWPNLLFGLLVLAAMAGAWFGRRAGVVAVALVAAGLWLYQWRYHLGDLFALEPVLPLSALVILVIVRERLPRSWRWLAGVWYLDYLVRQLISARGAFDSVIIFAPFGIAVAAIVWSVIDARVMLATSLTIAVVYGYTAVLFYSGSAGPLPDWYVWRWSMPALLGVAVAAVATWRVRRQVVL